MNNEFSMSRDRTHYFGKPPNIHKAMLGENLPGVNSTADPSLLSYCSKTIGQLSLFEVLALCSSVALYYLEYPPLFCFSPLKVYPTC